MPPSAKIPGRVPVRSGRALGITRAFTLTELLIVVLVLSIVMMTAIPMLRNVRQEPRLARAAADVAAAMQFARARAAAEGGRFRVRFPAEGDRVVVERYVPSGNVLAGGDRLPAALVEEGTFQAIAHPLEKRETNAFLYVVRDANDPKIAGVDFGGTNAVVFEALGYPSSGGKVVIALESEHRVVTVEPVSGRIRIGD